MHKAFFFLPSLSFFFCKSPGETAAAAARKSPAFPTSIHHTESHSPQGTKGHLLFVRSFVRAHNLFSAKSFTRLSPSLSLSSFSKGGGGAQIGSGSKLTLSSFSSPPSVPLQLWCTRKNLPHSLGSPSFEETVVRSSSFFPDRRMDRPSLSPIGK